MCKLLFLALGCRIWGLGIHGLVCATFLPKWCIVEKGNDFFPPHYYYYELHGQVLGLGAFLDLKHGPLALRLRKEILHRSPNLSEDSKHWSMELKALIKP